MNKYISLFLSLSILSIFMSCEDVIELELEDSSPQFIIEAVLDMDQNNCTVLLSKSNGFYESTAINTVNATAITLTDADGNNYDFSQETDGRYIAENITVAPEQVFTLAITDEDGQTYTASSSAPYPVALDSLEVEEFVFPFGDEENYRIFINWVDLEGVDNFYRSKIIANDTFLVESYNIVSDEIGDGEELRLPLQEFFEIGEEVEVQLQSIDENSYEYFIQIEEVQGEGGGNTTPYNPKGNFDNGALGYFGIISTSSKTVVVEK